MTPTLVLGGICLFIGSFFSVVGGIGIMRMPDFYTRAHAASVTDTMGAGMILLGLIIFGFSYSWIVVVKLIMVGAFMFVTGPTAGHALCKAALEKGPKPVLSDEQ